MRNVLVVVVMLTESVAAGSLARACSQHGTGAGSIGWLPTNGSGDVVGGLLSLETSLVAPTGSTTCTAGIGLGSLDAPLPAGFDVTDMQIVVLSTTDGSHVPLSAFSFSPNSATTAGLAAGSGSSSVPDTNPLFAGSEWFGFSSAVDPFVPPALGPDEVTAFLFTLEVPRRLLPLSLDVQFAGGEGQSNGTPIFAGGHPVQYFTAVDPSVEFVPEPSALVLALLATAGIALAAGRRRRS